MDQYKNMPIIEHILTFAEPNECEQVKNYFLGRFKKNKSKQSDKILLGNDRFTSDMLKKVARLLYHEYSMSIAFEIAQREKKRWELYKDDFMLDVEDFLSRQAIDGESYYFDPGDCSIKSGKKHTEKMPSILKTVEEYTDLLREALDSPLKAGRMAHDVCLPAWLQAFGAAITEKGFRSGLRKEVEKAIENPAHARMWELTASEDGMEDWVVEMFHILGMRTII
jgi:hypothetical protein